MLYTFMLFCSHLLNAIEEYVHNIGLFTVYKERGVKYNVYNYTKVMFTNLDVQINSFVHIIFTSLSLYAINILTYVLNGTPQICLLE